MCHWSLDLVSWGAYSSRYIKILEAIASPSQLGTTFRMIKKTKTKKKSEKFGNQSNEMHTSDYVDTLGSVESRIRPQRLVDSNCCAAGVADTLGQLFFYIIVAHPASVAGGCREIISSERGVLDSFLVGGEGTRIVSTRFFTIFARTWRPNIHEIGRDRRRSIKLTEHRLTSSTTHMFRSKSIMYFNLYIQRAFLSWLFIQTNFNTDSFNFFISFIHSSKGWFKMIEDADFADIVQVIFHVTPTR